jgi:hypothetical protein
MAATPRGEAETAPSPQAVKNCPERHGELALLRIICGRTAEYWTLRCIGCGGIHLNIVDTAPRSGDRLPVRR